MQTGTTRRSCRTFGISIWRVPGLLFFLAALVLLSNPALSQDWTGQVQCQLNLQTQDYALQEVQTWTVSGPPYLDSGIQVYPVKWASQSRGVTQRRLGINSLAGQWVGNVAPMETKLIIAVRPSDQRLTIRRWTLPLQAPGAITGAKQTTSAGGPPNQTALTLAAYEWPLPIIEDSPTNTNVVGNGTSNVAGNLMPLHTPDGVLANCQWHFVKGTQQNTGGNNIAPGATGRTVTTPIAGINGNLPTMNTPPATAGGGTSPTTTISNPPVVTQPVAGAPTTTVTSLPPGSNTLPKSDAPTIETGGQLPARCNSISSFGINGHSTHFTQGTTVNLGAGVQVLSVNALSQQHLFTQIFVTENAPPGNHLLTVTTGDEVVSLDNDFTVTQPCEPTRTVSIQSGVTPASAVQGMQNMTVKIGTPSADIGEFREYVGAYFIAGVTKADFGPGITVSSLTLTSQSSATAVLSIAPDAPAGPRTISLNTASQIATASFEVVSPKKAELVLPPYPARCNMVSDLPLDGHDTHFAPGTTVSVGRDVQVLGVSVVNAQRLIAQIFISEKAAVGNHTVTVTTGDEVVSDDKNFTVTEPCEPTRTVTIQNGLTPASAVQGMQNMTVKIGTPSAGTGEFREYVGAYFLAGVTKADFGPGITVTSLTVTSQTSATAVINIAAGAAPGARTISLTTANQVANASFEVVAGNK